MDSILFINAVILRLHSLPGAISEIMQLLCYSENFGMNNQEMFMDHHQYSDHKLKDRYIYNYMYEERVVYD